MCTVTFIEGSDRRLCVGHNRDELRSRGKALPPQTWEAGTVRIVAPRDRDAGGTWVAANDAGLCVALLNYYQGDAKKAQQPVRSRGAVVLDLAQCRSLPEVEQRLAAMHQEVLEHTRPFLLGVVQAAQGDRGAQALEVLWDGGDLRVAQLALPAVLVSALWHREVTERARRAELSDLEAAVRSNDGSARKSSILKWFSSHDTSRSPRAVCMHRLLAQTVSHTWIEVGSEAVTVEYRDGSPCKSKAFVAAGLALAGPSGR